MHSQVFQFTCKVTELVIFRPHATSLMGPFNHADDEIPVYRGKYPVPKPPSSKETSNRKQDDTSVPQPEVMENPPKDPTDLQMKDPGN